MPVLRLPGRDSDVEKDGMDVVRRGCAELAILPRSVGQEPEGRKYPGSVSLGEEVLDVRSCCRCALHTAIPTMRVCSWSSAGLGGGTIHARVAIWPTQMHLIG